MCITPETDETCETVLSQLVPSVPILFVGQWDDLPQFAPSVPYIISGAVGQTAPICSGAPINPFLFCGASGAFSNFPVAVRWKRGKIEILFQVVPCVSVVSGGTEEQTKNMSHCEVRSNLME